MSGLRCPSKIGGGLLRVDFRHRGATRKRAFSRSMPKKGICIQSGEKRLNSSSLPLEVRNMTKIRVAPPHSTFWMLASG